MITAKINFSCKVCNSKKFYTMPLDEKTKSNDIVSSVTKYILECKKCGQKYLLQFNINWMESKK